MATIDAKTVIFQDIRDATKLLFNNEIQPVITVLMNAYYLALISSIEMSKFARTQYDIKTTGDGAMITLSLKDTPNDTLLRIFNIIFVFHKTMGPIITNFNHKYHTDLSLKFGWGISEGTVQKMGQKYYKESWDIAIDSPSLLDKSFPPGVTDFIGPCVVRASRLCDLARPAGIMIDGERFESIPKNSLYQFSKSRVELKGFSKAIPVWMSKEVNPEFVNELSGVYRRLESE